MNFSQAKKGVSLKIGLISLSLLILIGFIVYPSVLEIIKINAEIRTEKEELQRKLNAGQNIKQLRQDLSETESLVKKLNGAYILKGDELKLITELENLAGARKLTININPGFSNDPKNSNQRTIPLAINTIGEYNDQMGFLKDLETRPYYYNIKQINLSVNNNAQKPGYLMQLTGDIYMQN